MRFPETPNHRFFLPALCLVFLVGIFLRLPTSIFSETGSLAKIDVLHPRLDLETIGFDEALYLRYVTELSHIRYGELPVYGETVCRSPK